MVVLCFYFGFFLAIMCPSVLAFLEVVREFSSFSVFLGPLSKAWLDLSHKPGVQSS